MAFNYKYRFFLLTILPNLFCSGDGAIRTELCKEFCLETGAIYETPVFECYNGRALFPEDPSWGSYDLTDDILDSSTFTRKFYASKDRRCIGQTDQFELPFNECVGPFGQPYPWGKFEHIRSINISVTANKKTTPK